MSKIHIPYMGSGFFRELLTTALAAMLAQGIGGIEFSSWRGEGVELLLEDPPDRFSTDLAALLRERSEDQALGGKVLESPGTKVGGNDKRSLSGAFESCYGVSLPDGVTYPQLFREAMLRAADMIDSGKLDPLKSLQSANLRGEVLLGHIGGGASLIVPAVVKQMEFYERSTRFMAPTKGPTSLIKMDELWFALLGLGFLECYAGYYGGSYYFVTHPLLDTLVPTGEYRTALETIRAVTMVNVKTKRNLRSQEVYELALSLDLARYLESAEATGDLTWPVRIYKQTRMGKVQAAEVVVDVDLSSLLRFSTEYIRAMREREDIWVEMRGGLQTPLEALAAMAEAELSRPIQGDNEMLAYLIAKDLYRAISAGRPELILDVLSRALRDVRKMDRSGANIYRPLMIALKAFASKSNVDAVLAAAGG